jgi:hypothetical protein
MQSYFLLVMMNLLGKVAVFLNCAFSVVYPFKIDDSTGATFLGGVGIIGVIPTDTFIGKNWCSI